MVQHAILIVIAPPLLLAGRPDAALPWALPRRWSLPFAREPRMRSLGRAVSWFIHPLPAALVHGLALWIWHAPAFFTLALAHEAAHRLEHVSFFVTALLFWMSLRRAARSPVTVPAGVAAVFLTLMHGGILSALITFAPQTLYSWYEGRTQGWGLTALEDQQLAGLIMGAPIGLFYLVAGLMLVARLLETAQDERL